MKPGWKIRNSISGLSVALLLQAAMVNGVALTGCASDNTGSGGTTNIFNTNGLCHDACQGYAFAITQYQSCYCSNEAPANTVNVGECNMNCPGYPSEKCGGNGLYGYIALGPKPSGTAGGNNNGGGGGGQSQSQPQQTEAPPPSSTPAPEPSTVVNTVVSTQVNTFTPSSDPETVLVTTTASSQPSTAVVPVPVPESTDPSTSISPTTYTQHASTQRVTVSGQVVTSVVTSAPPSSSTPASLVTSSPDSNEPHQTGDHLSNGAVAGITIGALIAAALLGLALFFCWRQRRRSKEETENGLARNSSVLSHTGLLGRGGSNRRQEAVAGVATLPKINTSSILPGAGEPTSAHTDATQMSEARRSSKPIFVDSRLNPNAIMWQGNDSRTSIGTLQDNQDYSRPLEVRNPDQ